MKSEFDARPTHLQRESAITVHFLVCYLVVLLIQLLQAKVLGNEFSSEEVMAFLRGFNVCRTSERKYVNVSRRTRIIEKLAEKTGLPLLHLNLTKGEVKAISGCPLQLLSGNEKTPPSSRKRRREPHSTINIGECGASAVRVGWICWSRSTPDS